MSSLLTEEQIRDVARHEAIHKIEMCACPCFDAVMTIAAKWEEAQRLLKLEGMLTAFGALGETDPDQQ